MKLLRCEEIMMTKGSLLMRKVEKDPEGELSELSEALVICESIRITAERPLSSAVSDIITS